MLAKAASSRARRGGSASPALTAARWRSLEVLLAWTAASGVSSFSSVPTCMTVVVTGADGGIGSAFCRHYASKGDRVFACRRKTGPVANSLFDGYPNIEVVDGVDVTTDDGVGCLVKALEEAGKPNVDILINNAGVMMNPRNSIDIDIIRKSMDVNAYGALRVTGELLRRKLLAKSGSKLALITSKMGSMADNTSGGSYGYRMSKAALNAAGVSLAHDLKGNGIAVAILHPGWVRTSMTSDTGLIDTHESVVGMAAIIEDLNLQNSGTWWGYKGDVIPW